METTKRVEGNSQSYTGMHPHTLEMYVCGNVILGMLGTSWVCPRSTHYAEYIKEGNQVCPCKWAFLHLDILAARASI
jgi:hypothetical protein